MRILTSARAIHSELKRLIGGYTEYHWAVAWASVGFEAFRLLQRHKGRLRRMVVGIHLYPSRVQVAVASRLLAMERPDYFLCLNHKNRQGLCRAFGIPQSIDFESYWDLIVRRIVKDSVSWGAPEPGMRRSGRSGVPARHSSMQSTMRSSE